MPGGDCAAELAVYRFKAGAFRDGDGNALTALPDSLEQLHAYWYSRCGARPFPARTDIDPIDIPSLLHCLMLVDVLYDPLNFRYRLLGGHIVENAGRNVQGCTVRDLMAEGTPQQQALQEKVLMAGRAAAEFRGPICADLAYCSLSADRRRRLRALLLPLGPSPTELTMLLGGVQFLQ